MAKKKLEQQISPERRERKAQAEASLEAFIELIHPNRVLGSIHRKACRWISDDEIRYQLLLLPRDHGKSAIAGYYAAWRITCDPTLRILYISSTSNLATKQLKFIKDILTHPNYRLYWPDMVNKQEVKREKWTEREISVDHPKRKEEHIRDPSIFTAGLTTNIVGMHCDLAILDDVVVAANAYTEDNREKVKEQYGYLSSVEGTNSKELVVGTRYHPNDLYATMLEQQSEQYDDVGSVTGHTPMFALMEEAVESIGDGTGEFIWPRQQRSDGKWFGFDQKILADKRNKYTNRIHFRAQYYNDPQDVDSSPIKRDHFQYYDPDFLFSKSGKWYFRNNPLNVVAAVDFAFTLGVKSDYTSIVVIGVDGNQNYYVLDIDRFKTQSPSEHCMRIIKAHEKWGFRKIRAEVTAAQISIVNTLKESYIRPLGLSLSVDEFRPTIREGNKEERVLFMLQPKYDNRQIWHYVGGNCQVLEEELIFTNPAHDDVKDALAAAVDFAQAPVNIFRMIKDKAPSFQFHSRWGGVA